MVYFPTNVPSATKYGTAKQSARSDRIATLNYFVACVEHRMRLLPEISIDGAIKIELATIWEFVEEDEDWMLVAYMGLVRQRVVGTPPDLKSPNQNNQEWKP